jgi:pyridoxamine 5'-phosphate oxidase
LKDINKHIHSLRKDYVLHSLEEKNLSPSPVVQFHEWMDYAIQAGVPEANAVHLSTVSSEGRPSSRIVLLREFSEEGLVFYTNYQSRKGSHISENPYVAVTLFWPELERQVRVEGRAEKIDESKSDSYFHSRPLESRLGAWASRQSQTLESREQLEKTMLEVQQRYEGTEIPRPAHWGGYLIRPDYFEFWQGRANRLHDRISYTLENGSWRISRLFP